MDQIQSAERTYYPLALVLLAVSAGIVCDRYWPITLLAWLVAATLLLLGWLACRRLQCDQIASCVLLAAAFALGAALHHRYWHIYRADEIGRFVQEMSQPCCVEVIAVQSPRWVPAPPPTALRTIPQGDESELLVWVTGIRSGQRMVQASGWANLQVGGLLDHVRAGDRLRVMAQASRSAPPLNPGEFDFAAHQRAQRVHCRLFAEFPQAVQRLSRGSRLSPRRWLADIRSGGLAVLRRYIAPERATLAAAILLGAREQLDPHRNEDYLVTGTIHVLSVSGLHVGILAAAFFFVLRLGLLPERATLTATIALTLCYAALTDLQAPVVRASVLVVIACLAQWLGRSAIGFNTLAAAALVVLFMNPAGLFQAGPQLSFLAVATMIAFAPLLAPRLVVDPLDRLIASTRHWPVRVAKHAGSGLWRLWLVGALIWLTSTPLVWRQYGLVSPVALWLNTLLWLPISLAMYAGLATLVCGALLPFVGAICGRACDACLLLLERTIAAGRQWPLSHLWHSPPPAWWIALFYIALGLMCAFPPLRPPRRWLLTLGVVWTAAALVLTDGGLRRAITRENSLRCTFVAVGHGVSVLVELPDGRNLLYDSGRLGSPLAGVRPVSAVLWSRGISHLDAIVISHADADHFNAIPGLLERFSAGTIYVSPVMFDGRAPAVAELRAAISRQGVVIRELYGGQRLNVGPQAVAAVLHPPQTGIPGSDNANSIVLSIEHAGHRILLTGDLETPGLEEVLIRDVLDCDIVLAPHHGSLRSSPGQFADWSRPEHVIISGRISPTSRATTERVKDTFRRAGAEVYHTAEDGAIRVISDQSGLSVTTHRRHVRVPPGGIAPANFLQGE